MEDYIYSRFVGPVIKALYVEVFTIGLFAVAVGYARKFKSVWYARTAPSTTRDNSPQGDGARVGHDFWKRVVLLGSVMLFTTYIVLAYGIDTVPATRPSSPDESVFSVQVAILLIAPLELLMVSLGAGLFLVLSLDLIRPDEEGQDPSFRLKSEPGLLFTLTGAWHASCAAWWTINLGDNYSLRGIAYHSGFAAAHFVSAVAWFRRRSARTGAEGWTGTIVYCALVLSVYISRLGWYVRYAMEK